MQSRRSHYSNARIQHKLHRQDTFTTAHRSTSSVAKAGGAGQKKRFLPGWKPWGRWELQAVKKVKETRGDRVRASPHAFCVIAVVGDYQLNPTPAPTVLLSSEWPTLA
jgi:hypothetical protein